MNRNKSSRSLTNLFQDNCDGQVTIRLNCPRSSLVVLFMTLFAASFAANAMLMSSYYSVTVREPTHVRRLEEKILPQTISRIEKIVSEHDSDRKLRRPDSAPSATGKSRQARPKENTHENETTFIKPNPDSLSPDASFSACLLIRDDNDILPEWIAYHYFSLKLRNLIVAVDPHSTEFPSEILQKWSNSTDLKVREWTDQDYMPQEFLDTGMAPPQYRQTKSVNNVDNHIEDEHMIEVDNHRYRQRVFLSQCMKQFRDDGATWVIHIDTDEYVVASKLLRQMNPSYVNLPAMDQPNSILTFIQSVTGSTSKLIRYPCISMLRVLFGSVENQEEDDSLVLPKGFDRDSFETLRWKHHALPHDMTVNGNPKVILDISVVPDEYFPDDLVYSIHRPVREFCQKNSELSFTSFRKQPIAVNHYLGSWERYSGRKEDKRRSREVYDKKALVNRGRDDTTLPWLSGFVREFGEERAMYLLGDQHRAHSNAFATS